jgi:hypothetical protein
MVVVSRATRPRPCSRVIRRGAPLWKLRATALRAGEVGLEEVEAAGAGAGEAEIAGLLAASGELAEDRVAELGRGDAFAAGLGAARERAGQDRLAQGERQEIAEHAVVGGGVDALADGDPEAHAGAHAPGDRGGDVGGGGADVGEHEHVDALQEGGGRGRSSPSSWSGGEGALDGAGALLRRGEGGAEEVELVAGRAARWGRR